MFYLTQSHSFAYNFYIDTIIQIRILESYVMKGVPVLNYLRAGCLISLFLLLSITSKADNVLEPWSVTPATPVINHDLKSVLPSASAHIPVSVGSDMCFFLLTFYQRYLSVVIVSHCSMNPSCSRYSLQAIQQHGPLAGIPMTADRLFHEWTEQDSPLQKTGKMMLHNDPVADNDFWWRDR